jgi:hypothetical protein
MGEHGERGLPGVLVPGLLLDFPPEFLRQHGADAGTVPYSKSAGCLEEFPV